MKQNKSKVWRSLLLLTISLFATLDRASAQSAEFKANVAAGAVAIFNPSVEVGFGSCSALTFDYVGAYSEYDYLGTGYPLLVSMNVAGYRRYLKRHNHTGFYYGVEFATTSYRMSKNIVPLVNHDKGTNAYDNGHGFIFGATTGYKYPINKHFSLEANLSIGWQHSRHEGWTMDGTKLYDFNISAEWLPYKAGIYLVYKLF